MYTLKCLNKNVLLSYSFSFCDVYYLNYIFVKCIRKYRILIFNVSKNKHIIPSIYIK